MTDSRIPAFAVILMYIGVIVCSLLSGIFIIPAIAIFTVLCVAKPSPFLTIPPIICVVASVLYSSVINDFSSLASILSSLLIFILPAVFMSISYKKEFSKVNIVISGALGLFICLFIIVIISFISKNGSFSRDLINQYIDNQITGFIETARESFEAIQSPAPIADFTIIEETLYLIKPLIPAAFFAWSFIISYISVCISNSLLKAINFIEKSDYTIKPHFLCGIISLILSFATTLVSSKTFFGVALSSVYLAFVPMFLICGIGVVRNWLIKITKNKLLATILIVLILISGTIIYNLFYFVGIYYSIIFGIKNSKRFDDKGGKQ